MAKRLSEDQTLQLVTLYKQHECLWDITSKHYKSKAMREAALKRISEEMQIESFGVQDIKYKIKTIRSTYYLELDKIKKSAASGDGGSVYKPRLKWFAELDSFIKNVIAKRNMQEIAKKNTHGNNGSTAELPEPRPKRNKISQLSSEVNNVELLQDNIRNTEKEDEFDIFGKHVAKQLRKLSTEQSILAQEQIQSVITKCRLNDLCHQRKTLTVPSITPSWNTQAETSEPVKISQSN